MLEEKYRHKARHIVIIVMNRNGYHRNGERIVTVKWGA